MKFSVSGSGPAIGVSKNGPAPSGSIVDRAVAREERRDLRLRGDRVRRSRRRCRCWSGRCADSWHAPPDRREGEVVAEEGRAIGQIAGAHDRLVVGFGTVMSPFANWKITGLAALPCSGCLRMNGAYVTGLPDCDTHSVRSNTSAIAIAPGHVVDHRRLVAQRDVLVEHQVERQRHARRRRQVDERRLARRKRDRAEHAKHRAQAHDLDDRAAGHVRHAGLDRRLDAEEDRAVDAAERLPGVVDAAARRGRRCRRRRRRCRPGSGAPAASGRRPSGAAPSRLLMMILRRRPRCCLRSSRSCRCRPGRCRGRRRERRPAPAVAAKHRRACRAGRRRGRRR